MAGGCGARLRRALEARETHAPHRSRSFASIARAATLRALRTRLVRRRLRGAEHRRVLVLYPLRPPSFDHRLDLFRSESSERRFRARSRMDLAAHRLAEHDGLHTPAVEHSSDPRAVHGERAARDRRAAAALFDLADG